MQKLTEEQLNALLTVSVGPCNIKNDAYNGEHFKTLEQMDYITPWSEFRARAPTEKGKEVLKNALRATQGLSVLNEEEPSDQVRELMDGAVGIVEANSYETMCLWQRHHKELGKTWEQGRGGYGITVGYVGFSPVCMSLHYEIVDGQKILVIEATSPVLNHDLIEQWLLKNVPKTAFKQNGQSQYLNKNNAMNFHNCLR